MPTRRFIFSLKLTNAPNCDEMLAEVAGSVLGQLGYPPDSITDVLGLVRDAVRRGAEQGLRECDARFAAGDGELSIVLAYATGGEWRIVRPLP